MDQGGNGRPTADEERLVELLRTLEDDARAPADFHSSVMRAVADVPPSPWRRFSDWWLRPRPVNISPAIGALAAAVSVALLFFAWPGPRGTDVAEGPAAPASANEVVTRFVLVAPAATSVHLTGDFLSWSREGIALDDLRGTGIWTADVPLPPGVYQYTFVIDGNEWVPDPTAMSQVDDGFGQVNSVVIVPSEGEA